MGGSGSQYRADPTEWFYIFPGQYADPASAEKYGIKSFAPPKCVGEPDGENREKDQIRVTYPYLRARTSPSLNGFVEGYIREGVYDAGERRQADGYSWTLVEERLWIAEIAGVSEYIKRETADITVLGCTPEQAKTIETQAETMGLKTERRAS